MLQENVEIVRCQFQAWNPGDFDKWAEDLDRDVVVAAPEAGQTGK